MENHRAHVIVLPYPAQGHINPMVQFAKRLASKGLKATIATTPYTINSISAPGVSVEPISDGFDQGGYAHAGSREAYLEAFKTSGSRTLAELIQKFSDSGSPVNCVVYDSFLPWALDVAHRHGSLGAAFFTNSAAVCSMFCWVHHGQVELPVTPEETPLSLPGLPDLDFPDLPSLLSSPRVYPAYTAMLLNQYSNVREADWIFGNTFQHLENQVVKEISSLWPVKLIGPMVPSSYLDGRIKGDRSYGASLWKPMNEKCIEWLDTKSDGSVIYVSFGSMAELGPDQMEEVACALRGSGKHFIWVVKEPEQSNLPDGFAQSVDGDKALIVTWCAQLEVLAHKALGCFVTHCGWNSTLEALGLGVPLVALPQWTDQPTNAKLVKDVWKVGVRAMSDEKGIVRREEIERSIKQVMEGKTGEEIKRNSAKWKKLAKEAVDEGGSSDRNIEDFVRSLQSGKDGKKTWVNGHS